MKCHYVYDNIAGKVLIPGCWGTVESGDMADCHCGTSFPKTYEQFEKREYNKMISNKNMEIKQLEYEIKKLNEEIRKLLNIPE
jgi:phage-related tail protein